MKMRVLAAVALIPVLLAVILVAPPVLTAILCGVLCAISTVELLTGTGLVKQVRLVVYSALASFFVSIWCYMEMDQVWGLIGILLYFSVMFAEVLLSHGKLRIERIAVSVFAGLVIPYMLSALVRIMIMDEGRKLILIPFILAFLADSGAYFVGCAWGKHKLAPTISPKKSVEGVVGGVAAAILGMLIYCLILSLGFGNQVNYAYAITYGVIGSLASVFGDLCFSAIKRQTGIKDYGKLIPGHGGALDRFDSMIIVAPLVELLLFLLPVLE